MRFRSAHHPLSPPIPNDWLNRLRTRPIETVERSRRQVVIEFRAVRGELCLKIIKNFLLQTTGILRRLDHQWWHCAENRPFCHPAFAMASDVMHNLATAGRMTDVHGILEIEMFGQRGEIVGV